MRRNPQWELSDVVKAYPRAAIIWMGLTKLASEGNTTLLCASRQEIAETAGLESKNLRSVGIGLKTLHKANWITLEHTTLQDEGAFIRVFKIWVHASSKNMFLDLVPWIRRRRARKAAKAHPGKPVPKAQGAPGSGKRFTLPQIPPEFKDGSWRALDANVATARFLQFRNELKNAYTTVVTEGPFVNQAELQSGFEALNSRLGVIEAEMKI